MNTDLDPVVYVQKSNSPVLLSLPLTYPPVSGVRHRHAKATVPVANQSETLMATNFYYVAFSLWENMNALSVVLIMLRTPGKKTQKA